MKKVFKAFTMVLGSFTLFVIISTIILAVIDIIHTSRYDMNVDINDEDDDMDYIDDDIDF